MTADEREILKDIIFDLRKMETLTDDGSNPEYPSYISESISRLLKLTTAARKRELYSRALHRGHKTEQAFAIVQLDEAFEDAINVGLITGDEGIACRRCFGAKAKANQGQFLTPLRKEIV